jgi:hypothetical protein
MSNIIDGVTFIPDEALEVISIAFYNNVKNIDTIIAGYYADYCRPIKDGKQFMIKDIFYDIYTNSITIILARLKQADTSKLYLSHNKALTDCLSSSPQLCLENIPDVQETESLESSTTLSP